MGVLVRSESVLRMLEDSGAAVDHRTKIARIPETMVKEALDKAPRSFKLCGRDPKNDVELPVDSGFPYITTDGTTIYMRDLETGNRRDATRADLMEFAKLADALDPVSIFWPIVTVTDVPELVHSAHEMWASQQGCTLNSQGDVLTKEDAQTQIALASLIVGGMDELRKRPIISAIMCPIAPLSFDRGMVEAQVELAKAGIPVVAMSMSLSGMSSPVTIAGTIVNVNTENLASLVITQFAQPGAPHIYSSESAPIDMMTGNMNFEAPEILPVSAAAGQMAKRYGRPCMVSGWGVEPDTPGITKSFCELASVMLGIFCNTDLAVGIGGFDDAKGCSFEQMVIDSLLWENFRAFLREFEISEESIALDVVKQVGHGNSFLTHPHTAKNFKKELFFWDKKKLGWEATLSDRMLPEAKETAKRLLQEHEVEPLDSEIVRSGNQILKEYEKRVIH